MPIYWPKKGTDKSWLCKAGKSLHTRLCMASPLTFTDALQQVPFFHGPHFIRDHSSSLTRRESMAQWLPGTPAGLDFRGVGWRSRMLQVKLPWPGNSWLLQNNLHFQKEPTRHGKSAMNPFLCLKEPSIEFLSKFS